MLRKFNVLQLHQLEDKVPTWSRSPRHRTYSKLVLSYQYDAWWPAEVVVIADWILRIGPIPRARRDMMPWGHGDTEQWYNSSLLLQFLVPMWLGKSPLRTPSNCQTIHSETGLKSGPKKTDDSIADIPLYGLSPLFRRILRYGDVEWVYEEIDLGNIKKW